MASMRIFTSLPQEDLRKVGPAAQAIEAAGYTGVTTQENKHDPFLSLAVAGPTFRIEPRMAELGPMLRDAVKTYVEKSVG